MLPSLPIIPLPTFEVRHEDIPGGVFRLKPFTIGLESILLQAKGLDEDNINLQEVIKAVHQIIDDCAVEPPCKAEELPTWCVELIYLRMRQNSIGEVVPLHYRCRHELPAVEGEEEAAPKLCGTLNSVELNLREVEVDRSNYNNKFVVHADGENSIAVQFKHMRMDAAAAIDPNTTTDAAMLAQQIELITHGDEVFKASAYKPADLLAFVKGIPLAVKEQIIETCFATIPTVRHTLKFKCKGCGHDHEIMLEGLKDFFG